MLYICYDQLRPARNQTPGAPAAHEPRTEPPRRRPAGFMPGFMPRATAAGLRPAIATTGSNWRWSGPPLLHFRSRFPASRHSRIARCSESRDRSCGMRATGATYGGATLSSGRNPNSPARRRWTRRVVMSGTAPRRWRSARRASSRNSHQALCPKQAAVASGTSATRAGPSITVASGTTRRLRREARQRGKNRIRRPGQAAVEGRDRDVVREHRQHGVWVVREVQQTEHRAVDQNRRRPLRNAARLGPACSRESRLPPTPRRRRRHREQRAKADETGGDGQWPRLGCHSIRASRWRRALAGAGAPSRPPTQRQYAQR